jgi:uncharacterized protein YbjT (DUF2867 family)
MILVTGAGGNVGGSLIRQLAAAGEPVRALSRRPGGTQPRPGVEVAEGDLAKPESLPAAFDGISGLFLLGGFDTVEAVLAQARAGGVDRVVLLTSRCVIGGAPDNAITAMWLRAEHALQRSGLPGTVLRPSGFQSNVLRWKDQLDRDDVVRAPWPEAAIAAIDPRDIAAVAAVALTGNDYRGESLELSGPEALTPARQVAILAGVLGRPLRYEPQAEVEARAQLSRSMPESFVDAQFRFFSAGEFDDSRVVDTVQRVTGRPAGTLRAWAVGHRPALG